MSRFANDNESNDRVYCPECQFESVFCEFFMEQNMGPKRISRLIVYRGGGGGEASLGWKGSLPGGVCPVNLCKRDLHLHPTPVERMADVVKTLPCLKLRLWVVNIQYKHYDTEYFMV